MSLLYETIKSTLEEVEINYDYIEDKRLFHFGINTNNGSARVGLSYDDDAEYAFLFSTWDNKVPKKGLPAVYPVLNEINNNTRFTTICVDPEDGELSAHCGINLDGTELSNAQVIVSIRMLLAVLDDNVDNIMRTAYNAPAAPIN